MRALALAGMMMVAALAGTLWMPVAGAQEATSLDELIDVVKNYRRVIDEENKARERTFINDRDNQRAILQQVQAELATETERSDGLKARFDANEAALGDLEETVRVRVGDMGELFGVVRQIAGDTNGIVSSSLVTSQYPERAGTLLQVLADAKALPSIQELDDLRVLLMEEMVESGKVVRFRAPVTRPNGEPGEAEVVRVGVFNLVSGDRFLSYSTENSTIAELPKQPAKRFRELAGGLFSATEGVASMAVDPTYGGLLGLLIDAPGTGERIHQGGVVGYVILFLGALGLTLSVERIGYLTLVGGRIRAQLKSDTPDQGNALGRILSVYRHHEDADTETLELKLDEAILKETPRLEKRQNSIKVLAAVAPLLGLLGTVTGMIETFQQITLFGTGDPRLMAGGISQALVTTMLGLVVAIPLVLLHSVVSGRSKSLIEILEEQSAGIIAAQSERLR